MSLESQLEEWREAERCELKRALKQLLAALEPRKLPGNVIDAIADAKNVLNRFYF